MSTCRPVFCFLASVSFIVLVSCSSQRQIDIIERNCGKCHPASVVYETRATPEQWRRLVYGMKERGLRISEAEEKKVMEILYSEFGRKK